MSSKRLLADRSDLSDIDYDDQKRRKDCNDSILSPNMNSTPTSNMADSRDSSESLSCPDEIGENISIDAKKFILFFHHALSDENIQNKLSSLISLSVTKKLEKHENEIKLLCNTICDLTSELEDLQQYTRRNSLRITGIPETTNESTDQIILDLAHKHLDVALDCKDIDRSHRVGRSNNQARNIRPILVKFTTYRARESVITKRSHLKRNIETKTIYINEDLTAKKAGLAKRVRQLCKERPDSAAKTWTYDGRIYLLETNKHGAKKVVINNERDLEKYLSLNLNVLPVPS